MGTRWSPHDSKAQEKYKRGKENAETSAAKAKSELEASTVTVGNHQQSNLRRLVVTPK